MSVNIDRINNDLDKIVKEFKKLLDKGKYTDAIALVNDIESVYNGTKGIELSRGANTSDSNFHELFVQIVKTLRDKETAGPVAGSKGADFATLKTVLANVSANTLVTNKIRKWLILKDPEMDEYKRALEIGKIEAKKNKKILDKEKAKADFIYHELFVDKSVNPEEDLVNVKIREQYGRNEMLKKVKKCYAEISSDIATASSTTDPKIKKDAQDRINKNKNEVKSLLNKLVNTGFSGITNIGDYIDESKITANAKQIDVFINSTKKEYEKIVEKIRNNIKDAQNRKFEYTDADGNKINLADDNWLLMFPDVSLLDIENNVDDFRELTAAMRDFYKQYKNLGNQIKTYESEIEIYDDQVSMINLEQEILAKDPNDRQAYIDNMSASTKAQITIEKTMRHQDAKDKFYGDRSKAKEYKAAWKRFESHKVKQTAVEVINGQVFTYEYDSIEDGAAYPEKKADMTLMQIESWEAKSKKIALVKEIMKKEKNPDEQAKLIAAAYGDDSIQKLEKLVESYTNGVYYSGNPITQDAIRLAENDLVTARARANLQYQRDMDYVTNFNGAHFDVKDTVALALTGGSAMRARSGNKKNLTAKDVLGAIFKWTPYERKADGKVHPIRTTIANIAGIASLPVRTLQVGIGAGVAGITAAVGKITGTYNMPTPYNIGYIHRKEARQEYLLKNGSSKIGAWFKSFFNVKVKDENGNKVKINDKLIADRCKLIDMSIEDKYIRGAREKLIHEQIEARKNVEARKRAYRNQVKSAEMYEDIYNSDPKSYIGADPAKKAQRDSILKQLNAEAMRRGALSLGGLFQNPMTKDETFVKNGARRTGKFVQPNPGEVVDPINYNLNRFYDFTETVGDTINTNAISRENIQRGNTKGMNLALRLASAPIVKGILSKWTVKYKQDHQQLVQGDTYNAGAPQTTKVLYQDKPIYGNVTKNVTTTQDVKISYDNATFGDLNRGSDAYWCADLGKYTGPHPAGHFSADATQIQGFNLSFNDPLNGQHIEWSTSINEYKNFIDNHPGLHEFSTTYQDLSGIQDNVPISKLTDFMPDNIKEAYLRYLDNSQDKLTAFNDATQFAYGVPTTASQTMGQGWSAGDILLDTVKQVSETKPKTFTEIVGYESVPVENVAETWSKVIEKYDIPDDILSKAMNQIDMNEGIAIGAQSPFSELLGQLASPRYRQGQKNTINYYDKDDNGNLVITGAQGRYDMYESPVTSDADHATNTPAKYNKYDAHHSQKNKAFDAIDSNGNPVVKKDKDDKAIRRTFNDDDFVL